MSTGRELTYLDENLLLKMQTFSSERFEYRCQRILVQADFWGRLLQPPTNSTYYI